MRIIPRWPTSFGPRRNIDWLLFLYCECRHVRYAHASEKSHYHPKKVSRRHFCKEPNHLSTLTEEARELRTWMLQTSLDEKSDGAESVQKILLGALIRKWHGPRGMNLRAIERRDESFHLLVILFE